jgi:hypothetical protein
MYHYPPCANVEAKVAQLGGMESGIRVLAVRLLSGLYSLYLLPYVLIALWAPLSGVTRGGAGMGIR